MTTRSPQINRQPGTAVRVLAGILLLFGLLAAAGCAGAVRPTIDQAEALTPARVLPDIRRSLRNGDWLVVRGLTGPDHFIAAATNMPLSHAALYDKEFDSVIEALKDGVRRTPLEKFVAKTQRILIIRPVWSNPETAPAAVARARGWLGAGYNYTGLAALGLPGRYYCTQLAVLAYAPDKRGPNPIPRVIAPGQMYHWGRIIYDSGP